MQPITKRETEKQIEISGRKFIVTKFDAFTGTYILYQLLNLKLPSMLSGMLSQHGIPLGTDSNAKMMSKEEFTAMQKDCLRFAFEPLKAGKTCIIDENGNFGVVGLETDLSTVILLTFEVLRFNGESFFGENLSLPNGETESSSLSQPNA